MPLPNADPISVVMPVRNAAPFLEASIGSILGQSFRDFELVVLDDASDDGSREIVERLARGDSRIRLFRSEQPLGVVGSSNLVVAHARHAFVARMDGDDLSHPERLARQVAVLRERSDVVAVGALHDGVDSSGARVRPRDRWRLLVASQSPPFAHGSVMFRRSVFDAVGGYRRASSGWEDQDLFLRMAHHGQFVVLPEVLYSYRYHGGSTSARWALEERERIMALRTACLSEHRSGSDYSHLLGEALPPPVTGAVVSAAVRYEAGMHLWGGDPPASFHSLLRHARRPDALLWAAWGSIHPPSLRSSVRALIRMRDWVAGLRIHDGKAYRWRFA